jgi:hypothetical protein
MTDTCGSSIAQLLISLRCKPYLVLALQQTALNLA